MMKIIFLFLGVLFVSCHSQNNKKQVSFFDDFYKVPYVISVKDSLRKQHHDSLAKIGTNYIPIPHFPKTIGEFGIGYGNVNIIFYSNNRFFFHLRDLYPDCGTGLKEDEVDFLNLKPKDLVEISQESIWDIIKQNEKFARAERLGLIVFSSLSDSIKNPIFTNLLDSMKTNRYDFYAIRRISEEEKNVLAAKTKANKILYYKSDYDWKMKYRNELVRINYLPPKIRR